MISNKHIVSAGIKLLTRRTFVKKCLINLIAMLCAATTACAADSISVGLRAGTTVGDSSFNSEAFGDYYLNRLVSIGATLGYTAVDRGGRHTIKRDESVPITALFKVYAPTPVIKPYAGLGQAVIFHDRRGTKGSIVGFLGINLPIGPVFLNAEYRRQLDDKLDILAAGVGIGF